MAKPSLGVTATILGSLRSWRQTVVGVAKTLRPSCLFRLLSVAHFVGWDVYRFGSPGSASPSPGASTLFARFAGWSNDFFQPTTVAAKTYAVFLGSLLSVFSTLSSKAQLRRSFRRLMADTSTGITL